MAHITSVILARRLVDNGRMLQATQIKHSNTAVLTATDKDIDAVGAEADIIHLLVMCNELRLGRQGGDIPDCTCCVNA